MLYKEIALMKRTERGQITRLCAGGQFIAATGITGAVNARTQGNYTAGGLSQNGTAHKTKATPKGRQCGNTKPVQDNYMSAISAMNAGKEKALILTICNLYGGCTAWRASIAVYDHFSAVSTMCHAANNGAVFFDGVGVASTDSVINDTPRRPSMVLLVGERSRSLAILLAGLPIPASNATSTAVKKHLHTYNGLGYVYAAPYKTGAGRRNPKLSKATPDAVSVFFCVCYTCHSMAWCAHLMTNSPQAFDHATAHHAAHNGAVYCLPFGVSLPLLVRVTVISRVNSTSRRPIMVTLAGQSQGWPVPFDAGIPTPVNVTAPIERRNSSGDSLNQSKEAV
ncbi:hypothetical protein FGS56_16905 [Salmonella enterica]|nr:hypothetical protein [Salmonella enterica]